MTTTKPTDKTGKAPGEPRLEQQHLTEEELKTIHEIHALAHVLYGHIATAHPWAAPMTPFAGFDAAIPEPMSAPMPKPWAIHGYPGPTW
jgi:hypothetical protein